MKTALVCGAGGFIGSHMVKRLKKEGYWVRGVDLKYPEFEETAADDFFIGELTDEGCGCHPTSRPTANNFNIIYLHNHSINNPSLYT